ncbi:hypothetical protein HPP92_001542 [Vanilla planifolia]|uniref:RRM domain-containing protein n=1 Tax=Vanilla planifolia TaxID=51239 RepID=A0A835RRA4_VANPL|nr:hypothetical protein HPP92_001542 [Vanilla planifolia]
MISLKNRLKPENITTVSQGLHSQDSDPSDVLRESQRSKTPKRDLREAIFTGKQGDSPMDQLRPLDKLELCFSSTAPSSRTLSLVLCRQWREGREAKVCSVAESGRGGTLPSAAGLVPPEAPAVLFHPHKRELVGSLGAMAEQHSSAEPDEQIDLDGDNDIEDMMDDEDVGDEDGYRRVRDEYNERQHDEYHDEDHVYGSEGHDKVSSPDELDNASSPLKDEVFVLLLDIECGFININRDAAQKAIEEIQDKEFKGKTLRCSLSQVKHRLFIGNVPKSLAEEELRRILEEAGPGVENIECFKDPQNPSRNRGFVFVEYYNNACADHARQRMSKSSFKIDGSSPTVSWADPKNSVDASAASQVKAVYVKNLPENVSSEKLKELFERHGEITKVVLPPAKSGQKRDFGFVHFAERSSALKAIKGTEKYEIDGHALEVSLAKPQTDKKLESQHKPGLLQSYPAYPSYGYPGDPYGAYGGGGGYGGVGQPMIYGRGPMPAGMRMVPMVLPDGRLGYVLQQPGGQPSTAPPSHHRSNRGGGSGDGGDRGRDGYRGRRYRPY